MRRIIRLFATSAVVTAGTIAATAAAASADVGVGVGVAGAGATVHWVPLGTLLFSDRNIKRDIVPVQWVR